MRRRWPLQRRLVAVMLAVTAVVLLAIVAGFVTVVHVADGQSAHDKLVVVFAGATLLILLVTALLTTHLVRYGLRPLAEIATTASRIKAGDLSPRLLIVSNDDVGQLAAVLNTMLDRIETAFAERRAADERLRRFVHDAGHELRTPVTAIRGWADLHQAGAISGDEVTTAMRRIADEAHRIAVLVDQLLTLASLDEFADAAVAGPGPRRTVDLVEIVRDAVLDAQAIEPDRPITTDLPGRGVAVVLGDPMALHQVVANLLGNIRAHTPAATPARIWLWRDADRIALRVADDGPGVPAHARDKLFDRFYRAEPGRAQRSGTGAGLGLSIVAAIVAAHGGDIRVEPTTTGLAIRISLPASTATGPWSVHEPRRLPTGG